MTKAAQYVRMSSDQQPLSIEMQMDAITAYAAEHGFEIVRTYEDDAKSGVVLNRREAMKDLLRDVTDSRCPFCAVLVLDVSRWGRFQDADESAYYEYHCRKHGVEVIYVAETFGESLSPLAALLKQMRRAQVAGFSRDLGIKCRAAQIQVVKMGFSTGQLPCLGYRREAVAADGTTRLLEHHERKPHKTDHVRWVLGPSGEIEAIKKLFETYSTGAESIAAIARRLQADGMRSSYGKTITVMALRMLLRNEIVIGNFVWGTKGRRKTVTNITPMAESVRNSNMVPAIVDRLVWDKAQARTAASTLRHRPGAVREVLIEVLRKALRKNPLLCEQDFLAHGLKRHDLRKHFGNLATAYYAASPDSHAAVASTVLSRPLALRISKRFLFDVGALIRSAGANVEMDPHRNTVCLGRQSVKTRVARQVGEVPDTAWLVHQVGASEGRWLLILRLNSDGGTGKDFLLLPPEVHDVFRGRITARSWPALSKFCISDVGALLERLLQINSRQTTEDDLRWSS